MRIDGQPNLRVENEVLALFRCNALGNWTRRCYKTHGLKMQDDARVSSAMPASEIDFQNAVLQAGS